MEELKLRETQLKNNNPLICTAAITVFNTLQEMVNRKEIKKGNKIAQIQDFECLFGIKEEKEEKVGKMLQLFGTNSKKYLPALENPEKIQEVTDLVILILQILTKKEIQVFERERPEIKPTESKITAKIAIKEINKKRKTEKKIRDLDLKAINKKREIEKKISGLELEIKKINIDFLAADEFLTEIDCILNYLQTTHSLHDSVQKIISNQNNYFKVVTTLISRYQYTYNCCDFTKITQITQEIENSKGKKDPILFIENLYKSEVFLNNLLNALKSKIIDLELQISTLKLSKT